MMPYNLRSSASSQEDQPKADPRKGILGMRKAHARKIGILISIVCGFVLFPLPAKSGQRNPVYFLHAIVFESYLAQLPEAEKAYDTIELPNNEFPWKFSLLCAPYGHGQTLRLPPGVAIPHQPMFLDIYTFRIAADQIQGQKRISRHNGIQSIQYAIKILSWSQDQYQVELDGRHEDFKFSRILVDASIYKTKIIRIRRSDSRILYLALTPIEEEGPSLNDVIPPILISRQPAVYPSELRKTRWSGTVRIRATVTQEGKIGREGFVFLECPHHLFARSSLDNVLNQWIYRPANRNGVPIEVDTAIEVGFTMLMTPLIQHNLQ
jgi:hypothetical protein